MTREAFLKALAADLPPHPRTFRFLLECRHHLEDAAAELEARGMADPEAEAVRRFGDPQTLAEPIRAMIIREERRRKRWALIFVVPMAVVSTMLSLLAVLGLTFAKFHPRSFPRHLRYEEFVVLAFLTLVFVASCLTFRQVVSSAARRYGRAPLLMITAAGAMAITLYKAGLFLIPVDRVGHLGWYLVAAYLCVAVAMAAGVILAARDMRHGRQR